MAKKKVYMVEDFISKQVLYFSNFKSSIEHPESPIDQSYRNAQRLKAEKLAEQKADPNEYEFTGFPIIIDGCRLTLIVTID